MSVKFENNVFHAKELLHDKAVQFLYEAGAELQAQVVENSRADTTFTRSKWTYIVDEGELKVIVGNPEENAIWEEFGTGEYALEGNGRKTPWYIPVDNYKGKKKPTYNGEVVIIYGKDGKKFYKTDGKKPSRALHNAMETVSPKLKKRINQLMKEAK